MTVLVVFVIALGFGFVYQAASAMWWRSEAKYWQRREALSRKHAENWEQAFVRLASKDK